MSQLFCTRKINTPKELPPVLKRMLDIIIANDGIDSNVLRDKIGLPNHIVGTGIYLLKKEGYIKSSYGKTV